MNRPYLAVGNAVIWKDSCRARIAKLCDTPERAKRLAKLLNDMRPK